MNSNNLLITVIILVIIHQISASLAIAFTDDDYCIDNSCPTNKVCQNYANGYICICPPGKVGSECQFNDPCLNMPAEACGRGYCRVTTTGTAECVCRPGITGKNCTEDINECQNNPCESNEICYNAFATFLCIPRRKSVEKNQRSSKGIIDWDMIIKTSVGAVALLIVVVVCGHMSLRYCRSNRNVILPARCTNRVSPVIRPVRIVVY